MILKLINNENTYEFNVTDLNEGVKLYYHFEIPTVDIPDGKYNMQLLDGETVIYEDIVCIGDFKGATIQYKRGDNIYINAPLVGKFEDVTVEITATQTTVYPNDGFDAMTSVVIDATPVYDDGYSIGYADGVENAIENAIVLNTTEIRTYYTKYSDNIVNPNPVTGIYPDGETFHNLANIENIIYDTGIIPNENTKLEFWFIPDDNRDSNGRSGLVYTNVDGANGWGVNQNTASNQSYYASLGTFNNLNFPLVDFTLNHIVMSYADGLIVNETKIGDFTDYKNRNQTLLINGVLVTNYSPDGGYGMIKITQDGVTNVIIPTEDGLKNITTDEMLEVVYNEGTYVYINNDPIILDNLIKQVNVNAKINVVENGLKCAYSTFTEVPDFYDFSNITDLKNMFRNCSYLQTIPEIIDFSNVTNMESCFEGCKSLQTITEINISNATNLNNLFRSCQSINTMPELPTHKAIYMNRIFEDCITLKIAPVMTTNNVTDVGYMFWGCVALQQIPAYDFSNVNSMGYMFRFNFQGDMNYLTDVGGWIGLKVNWNDNYGLARCPNLTYQSCINILNGLADVTELGGRTLKVHSNFLTTVGNEISIGTSKGWIIQS